MSRADVLADYLRRSIANEPRWHYRQYRPMIFGVPPEREQDADCSGSATQAYYWAGAPDPNPGCNYNGSGYTGTLINNPKVGAPYQIGDLGIYGRGWGNTAHVVTCFQGGDTSTARWHSHGSERAPYEVRLRYRSDLLCVVRPGLGVEDDDEDGGEADVTVPAWYWDWARWYVSSKREADDRPANAPKKIPEWAWGYAEEDDRIARDRGMSQVERDWVVWYLDGKQGDRPDGVPQTIPDYWWDDAEFVQAQRRSGAPAEG